MNADVRVGSSAREFFSAKFALGIHLSSFKCKVKLIIASQSSSRDMKAESGKERAGSLYSIPFVPESGRFKIHAIRIMGVTVKVNGMGRSWDKIEMFCEAN